MGTLYTWISIALLGLIQAKGILSLDVKSCNASKLIELNKELGIRGNVIPDASFSASTVSDPSHGPQRGRLDQKASGGQASSWCSQKVDSNQWIAVDLIYTTKVSGIATQGQYDPDSLGSNPNYTQSWVTKYTLEYSNNASKGYYPFEYKTEKPLVFKGNTDGNSTVCHELPYEITVRYLRFRPKEWNSDTICLRIGVFGKTLPNVTLSGDAFDDVAGDPGHAAMWWWPLFWVLLAVILVVLILGFLFYWCIVRKRTYPQEKYIKVKPQKPPIQRRPDKSYVNEAYDMTVINKSGATTPETVEELDGDEIQEVTAEFTADEQENKKGIVGFSVTDEDNERPDDDESVANGDVNWDVYRKRALQRPEHTYVNVKDINNET